MLRSSKPVSDNIEMVNRMAMWNASKQEEAHGPHRSLEKPVQILKAMIKSLRSFEQEKNLSSPFDNWKVFELPTPKDV